ncbi:hypothetical protein B0T20DRAFT_494005 [Sordaria brevicollis]|uniref:Uncharacterized protein n=1 Tax=Sordaria brevicollis TaxID=83679 RepID=A0AAE0NR76_SORBR|nr:hypothetical protein B0T20DRAFT_494005 [Sordaria brevicollis]
MAAPTFLYLSDDPQAYLLFLKDFIRPCPDICHNCKVRCCDNFIKTASAPDLGWNRISPDERLRPAHTFLNVQLSDLGIDSTNNYGLDLSEEEVNKVFQPAVRRLTLDSNWYTLVEAFAAMTCYRGMGRPDRAHDQYDQYKLGKKIVWMACPRFTAYELARPRRNGDIMAKWLWNLAQLLSDGADVYLSSPSLPKTENEYLSRPSSDDSMDVDKPADRTTCTCPLFSVLNGRHPDAFTGYEWINLVLRTAQSRIESSLLEAWSQPLTPDELLSSSTPYRPLCPGYDCRTDTHWQEDFVHKRNNVMGSSKLQNAGFEADVDLIRLLGDAPVPIDPEHHQQHQQDEESLDSNPGQGGGGGGGPFDYSLIDPLSSPPSSYHDTLIPGYSIPTGTCLDFDSDIPGGGHSFTAAFKLVYNYTDQALSIRFPHFFRQTLFKAYLARTFRYSPGCDTGESKIPDLFLRGVFESEPCLCPFPSSSESSRFTQQRHRIPLPPMKSLFNLALHSSHHRRSSILSIPLDLINPKTNPNTNRKVRPFTMPNLQRNIGANLENNFDFRPSSAAQGWGISHGRVDREGSGAADYEDACLFWGCRHLMRRVFEWEDVPGSWPGRLGWEMDMLEGGEGGEPR